MKKFMAVAVLCLFTASANAGIASPTEERKFSFKWHPTSVTIGAVAGAAMFGGFGAVVVGAVVGELVIRAIKDIQTPEQEVASEP